jgi:hypothetical protein
MTEKHDIIPQRTNANRHTERGMRLLEKSIAEDGWIGAVTVAANGETFDGSARVETTAANGMLEDAIVVQTDGSRPVVVVRSDIPTADDPRAKRLGVGANQIAAENLSWDSTVLASLAEEIDLSGLFLPDELSTLLEQAGTEILESAADEQPDELPPEAADTLYPSDNEWGIPTLDLKRQARGLDLPCERWGRNSRAGKMPGTYHFYTDDYKFSALWADPTPLVFSGCRNIIEPNVSTGPAMPAAVALWGIYRKRWLARWAQSYDVCVFVDLNVEPVFSSLNLLGVPRGWRAWATRGYDTRIELLEQDWQTATAHAETDDIIFVVVGGGQETHAACMARGWVHIPQENHAVEQRGYIDG